MGASSAQGSGPSGITKVMVYVDASNLVEQIRKVQKLALDPRAPNGAAFRMVDRIVRGALSVCGLPTQSPVVIRSYWFGSFGGHEEQVRPKLERVACDHGFEPRLSSVKSDQDKEKAVDIGLAVQAAVDAFQGNCDVALLLTGDADFVPLVRELKRYGLRVVGCFYSKQKHGMSPALYTTFDAFKKLEEIMADPATTSTIQTAAKAPKQPPMRSITFRVTQEQHDALTTSADEQGVGLGRLVAGYVERVLGQGQVP